MLWSKLIGISKRDSANELWLGTQFAPKYWQDPQWLVINVTLTPKHQEMHGCVISTVTTDALVLKHQAISIHNAD